VNVARTDPSSRALFSSPICKGGGVAPEADAFNVPNTWHEDTNGLSMVDSGDLGYGNQNDDAYNHHHLPNRLTAAPAPFLDETHDPSSAAHTYAFAEAWNSTYSHYPQSYTAVGFSSCSPLTAYSDFKSSLQLDTEDLVLDTSPANLDIAQGVHHFINSAYDGNSGSTSIGTSVLSEPGASPEQRSGSGTSSDITRLSRQTLSQIPGVPLSDRPARLRLEHSVSNFRTSLDSIPTAAHTLSNKSNISHRSSGEKMSPRQSRSATKNTDTSAYNGTRTTGRVLSLPPGGAAKYSPRDLPAAEKIERRRIQNRLSQQAFRKRRRVKGDSGVDIIEDKETDLGTSSAITRVSRQTLSQIPPVPSLTRPSRCPPKSIDSGTQGGPLSVSTSTPTVIPMSNFSARLSGDRMSPPTSTSTSTITNRSANTSTSPSGPIRFWPAKAALKYSPMDLPAAEKLERRRTQNRLSQQAFRQRKRVKENQSDIIEDKELGPGMVPPDVGLSSSEDTLTPPDGG
jgi:hypothetical protein